MKNILNKYKYVILIGLFAIVCTIDTVYAKTIVDFNICEFRATLQLLKLIGIVIIRIVILGEQRLEMVIIIM